MCTLLKRGKRKERYKVAESTQRRNIVSALGQRADLSTTPHKRCLTRWHLQLLRITRKWSHSAQCACCSVHEAPLRRITATIRATLWWVNIAWRVSQLVVTCGTNRQAKQKTSLECCPAHSPPTRECSGMDSNGLGRSLLSGNSICVQTKPNKSRHTGAQV